MFELFHRSAHTEECTLRSLAKSVRSTQMGDHFEVEAEVFCVVFTLNRTILLLVWQACLDSQNLCVKPRGLVWFSSCHRSTFAFAPGETLATTLCPFQTASDRISFPNLNLPMDLFMYCCWVTQDVEEDSWKKKKYLFTEWNGKCFLDCITIGYHRPPAVMKSSVLYSLWKTERMRTVSPHRNGISSPRHSQE